MNNHLDKAIQQQLAQDFHHLHQADNVLILQNAWDCTSAKIAEEARFKAIATTSSGISWANGYQDGEHLPPKLMIEAVQKIVKVVGIPVSVDMEAGYALGDMAKFGDFVAQLIEAGAVGINLEDFDAQTTTLNSIDLQQKLIEKAKDVGQKMGVNLFLNARTDAMTLSIDLPAKVRECIKRAKAFKDAGADGVFVPFTQKIETVKALKEGIELPLNILFTDSLNIAELKQLKINRISTGSRPILATISLLKKMAYELQNETAWPSLKGNMTYPEVNDWF